MNWAGRLLNNNESDIKSDSQSFPFKNNLRIRLAIDSKRPYSRAAYPSLVQLLCIIIII